MDFFHSQLDLGLDLDYDNKKQYISEFQKRLKVYNLKYAKRFKFIKYSLLLLQSLNVLIFWAFLYWDLIFELTSKNTDSTTII